MTPDRQAVFDAIYGAIRTHAPALETSARVAIATDAALKIEQRPLVRVCRDCGTPLGASCPRCQRLWES